MNENQGAIPGTGSGDAAFVPADISLSSAAQQFLSQTRPWVRFLSVMIFIAAALMIVGGVAMIAVSILAPQSIASEAGRGSPLSSQIGIAAGGLFYFALAFVYIAPGVFLSRYAGAIRLLESSRSAQALEDALRNQKSFWRYIGILTIVSLVLAAILIFFALFTAMLFIRR